MEFFYAVAVGKEIGIFSSWNEVQPLVRGHPGAKFKKFVTREEAQKFIDTYEINTKIESKRPVDEPRIEIFTDGSHKEGVTGFGVVIVHSNGTKQTISGSLPESDTTNNAAELYAIFVGLSITKGDVLIWSDSEYAINALLKLYTAKPGKEVPNGPLIEEIHQKMQKRCVELRHVKAHSKIELNEEADKLAKKGRTG